MPELTTITLTASQALLHRVRDGDHLLCTISMHLMLRHLTQHGLQCFDAVGWAAGRASGL